MTWRDKPMLGWDTETDSLNPEDARIVTACTGWASPEGWAPTNWVLKPDRPISPEATAIHGITTDYAQEYGVDRKTGLAAIRDALLAAWGLDSPVVIYNAPYDSTTLDRELRRNGLPGLRISGPVLDPLVLDKAIDRYRRGSRKLADVAAHYGIPLGDGAHDSTADALAAARLAWKLAPLLPSAALRDDLSELHAWQQAQYAEQRLSFAEYRRRKGQPLDDESTDWPVHPYRQEKAA